MPEGSHGTSDGAQEALIEGVVGTFEAVGFKLGGWVDTVLMQRTLGPGAAKLPDHGRG